MNQARVADNRYWLEHQRSLEFELLKARERQCSLKRAAGAPDLLATSTTEGDGDGWMLTYLDLITVLLVMLMAMLAQALVHRHAPAESAPPVMDIAGLTRVDPPGSLLLVPPVVAAPEPVPVAVEPEPVAPAPVVEEPVDPLADLPLEQLGSDIEVIHNARSVSFRIDSSILFHSGQTDLDPKGLEVLKRLAAVLKDVPHRIIVAGHTDTRTIRNAVYPSNWELSGARAGSVVRFLQQQGIGGSRMTAMGMAGTQPLADNGTPEGRAKNRRVELTLEKRG